MINTKGLILVSHWFYFGVDPLISVEFFGIYFSSRGIRSNHLAAPVVCLRKSPILRYAG